MKCALILAQNNRSKAYIQNMVRFGFLPHTVIVLQNGAKQRPEQTVNDMSLVSGTSQILVHTLEGCDCVFDEKEHVLTTLTQNNINYQVLPTDDVNSPALINIVRNLDCDYILVSSPGGVLLKKEILDSGKTFLHCHPGLLPQFPGSTTMYYSMLLGNSLGCSLIELNGNIDKGLIVFRRSFRITNKQVDFDYGIDPLIRAQTFLDFLRGKTFENSGGEEEPTKNFFVIHPLLKHLALLK